MPEPIRGGRRAPDFGPRVPTGSRDHLGNAYAMSDDAMRVLRAIRAEVTEEGTFRGSAARAAFLSHLPENAAGRALVELGSKGYVRHRGAGAARG